MYTCIGLVKRPILPQVCHWPWRAGRRLQIAAHMSDVYLYKCMLLIDHLVLWRRWRPALSVRIVVLPNLARWELALAEEGSGSLNKSRHDRQRRESV